MIEYFLYYEKLNTWLEIEIVFSKVQIMFSLEGTRGFSCTLFGASLESRSVIYKNLFIYFGIHLYTYGCLPFDKLFPKLTYI